MSDEIFINLGIDFGTRFTKVCARSEEVGTVVCDFSAKGTEGALLPSALALAMDGTLAVPEAGHEPDPDLSIGYLKMALAERARLRVGRSIRGYLHEEEGVVRGLATFYLSEVMRRARAWVETEWARTIGGREVIWSANVGLPVEHFDAPIADAFQRVFATAWRWSEQPPWPRNFKQVASDYLNECDVEDATQSVCQAYPEIAAAVLAFATSRSAEEGVYVYFDVGGGTLDGVVFALRRPMGEVHIDFYSGEVAALGVEWIAGELVAERFGRDDTTKMSKARDAILATSCRRSGKKIDGLKGEVQNLVTRVIYNGKKKDGSDWRELALQRSSNFKTLRRSTSDDGLRPMRVFIGGGGMVSGFYQWAIVGAYTARKMYQYGSPPLELTRVPSPANLDLRSVPPTEYHRFLIAFGLSVPFGEGPEFRLPSRFEDVERPKVRESNVPNYQDHKDIYD